MKVYQTLATSLTNETKSKLCLAKYFDSEHCIDKLIGSHSIAKSAILKSIEDNGKVMTWISSPFNLLKNKGVVKPVEIGIAKASVFGGFCEYHDRELFKEIDKTIEVFNDLIALQLHYRAICYEYFQKISIVEANKKNNTITDNDFEQALAITDLNALGNKEGIKDLRAEMIACEKAYSTEMRNNIHALVFEFNILTPVVCAFSWIPEFTIYGNPLFDMESPKLAPHITFTLGNNGDDKSYFAVTFTKNDSNIDEFISTLLEQKNKMLDIAIEFCLMNSQNSYMKPIWWNSLSAINKQSIITNFNKSLENFGKFKPHNFTNAKFLDKKYDTTLVYKKI